MPDPRRVRILVSGRVQGVCYRASTQEMALSLGLRGWVRNLKDGRVEALLAGPEGEVDRMIAWCRLGPKAAQVLEVQVQPDPGGEIGAGFEVRPTAAPD